MQYNFLNIFLDQKELLNQAKSNENIEINPFLLENNASQIEEIYNFYKGNVNLLYVNGFLGTGKAEIINYSTAFLSTETIVLKYNCFNSTILDDILLLFFNEFKKLSSQNIISEPKAKTENFTQRINAYFTQIEKPFVIILDSFEAILEENRQEILDFIFHLNTMQKIKIIIIGRTFESKYFKDIKIERITTFALEKQIFEKYLKSEKIKSTNAIIDEFYKHTRGYYFFTAFSIKVMQNGDLSLVDFLTKLKDSYLPFHKFLEKQTSTLIPATQRNLFWFLATIRHPISIDFLKKLNFYDEETINFLIENLVIIREDSNIYVQDYLTEEIDETTPAHILQKIHQYIIDIYLSQLPLKPLGRNICISRQTMRKEIEYHKLFLPKKPRSTENVAMDINYLSYVNVFKPGEKPKTDELDNKQKEEKKSIPIDYTNRKNIQINLENLPFQQHEEKIASQDTKPHPNQKHNEELTSEFEGLNLIEILEKAKHAESLYNYAKVINLYQIAISMKEEKDYQQHLPLIYTKIAYAYQKIANYENSLKYYELAQELYEKSQNFVKINQIKFNVAKICYETYKIEKAKELFLEIAECTQCQAILVVKSYLQLANLEEGTSNPQKAFEYYKQAIDYSDESMSIDVLSELYFKYALTMDDKNDIKKAIEFYNKCINLGGNFKTNKFLSSSYSNIATLYLEKNDTENAINNYTKAYEIDKQSRNLEGLYYSSSKLASILQRRQPEKALEYFNIALDCATLIKDIFYIVSASLAIGDYHYDRNQSEIALKYYLSAFNLAQNEFSQDNINKINSRINDIKFKLGVEKFENLVEIIRKQEQEQEHE